MFCHVTTPFLVDDVRIKIELQLNFLITKRLSSSYAMRDVIPKKKIVIKKVIVILDDEQSLLQTGHDIRVRNARAKHTSARESCPCAYILHGLR